VGEVGILVGVFEGRKCQQTAMTLNDGPFLKMVWDLYNLSTPGDLHYTP
jgi:hypothetical protein